MVTVWPIRLCASGESATSLAVTLKVYKVSVTERVTPVSPARSISLPSSSNTRPSGNDPLPGTDVTVILAPGASTSESGCMSRLVVTTLICGATKAASDLASDGMVSPFSSGRMVVTLPGPNSTRPRSGLAVVGMPVAAMVMEPARVMLVVASAKPSCSTLSPSRVMLPRVEVRMPPLSLRTTAPPGTAAAR